MNKMYLKLKVALLISLRNAISDHLPVGSSLVILDILMFVLTEYLHERPLTMKRLLLSLDLSHTGFRYHFKKLVDDNWINLSRLTEKNSDQRLRFITPSSKLVTKIVLISNIMNDQLEEIRNQTETVGLPN